MWSHLRECLSCMSWVFLGASSQWDMLGKALSRELRTIPPHDPIRDRVQRLLQIRNNSSVNMTFESNISQIRDFAATVLSTTTFSHSTSAQGSMKGNLLQSVMLSPDWGRDYKLLSCDEKGSTSAGPELHPAYEFLSKGESMKIHATLITHYLCNFWGNIQFPWAQLKGYF